MARLPTRGEMAIAALAVVLLGGAWYLAALSSLHPPDARGSIVQACSDVRRVWSQLGQAPSVLPQHGHWEGRDPWGRPLLYGPVASGVWRIESLGSDGVRGGSGLGTDVSAIAKMDDSGEIVCGLEGRSGVVENLVPGL